MANPLGASGIRQQSEPGHKQPDQEELTLHILSA
jgi:hypothetical protein